MFDTIEEGIGWIESIKRFGDKYDLYRMEIACKELGNPQDNLNIIHIAGTNGKGSTVSYLKHILLEQGYNVGTFTSPYIVNFNERITENHNDISNDDLLKYINKVKELYFKVLDDYDEVITFFELVTLISFMYFDDKNLDYVIYEVGLGGKLDATNVIKPMITAITSISFDHMAMLGDTIEEIALNKLGIVKEGIPLVTSVVDEELSQLFIDYSNNLNSELTVIKRENIEVIEYSSQTNFKYKNQEYSISMLGTHQVVNASLAIEIIHQLNKLKKSDVSLSNIKMGLVNTFWPGRFEMFGNIVIDGAHNVGGMNALRDSVKALFKGKYIKALYTSMVDKEYFDIIQILESFVDEVHFTQFDYPRCETADNLYNVSSHPRKFMHEDAIIALNELKDLKKNEILLVAGSLYFISLIRKNLK
ncbi:MAG: Folylpolyglutamate synthase [Candidatus Izimaplasma bacterium HR2]|nr:MAG: Folylpolyglutamate synthase [Candidatus Izimaplasma bacterium HR2]